MLIRNTQARLLNLGGHVNLKPGTNEVDPAAWAEAKKIEVVRAMLDAGEIVVVGGATATTPASDQGATGNAGGLELLSTEEAKATVANTFDRELLVKWQATASPELQTAIDDQLELVKLTDAEKATAHGAKKPKGGK